MADLVEPIPQVAIGDLAAVADRYVKDAGDATLMLVSCDNWVDMVRADGFTRFHAYMDRAIRVAMKYVPPHGRVLRLESDQFGIVTSGLTNREGRALAMRIQMLVSGAATPEDTDPIISVVVGHLYPGRATALEVINRAKDVLTKSHTPGMVVSVSSAPLADPWDDTDTIPIPTLKKPTPALPIRALPIVRIEHREVVAFELVTKSTPDLRDLSTALEMGQSLSGGLNLHVNIPGAWMTPGMMEEVVRRLEQGPSNTFQLCIEISAKAFTQDEAHFKEFAHMVRAIGCMVALDDVGFGATTLEQFVDIEPDIVKFHPTVLKELRGSNRARAARMVDVMTYGEHMLIGLGIEDDSDEFLFASTGVMLGQGPLYGPPPQ
ncbi:EAL domain-containing protein [Stomatohabitans albus]|uniref:EAL domain-containing protein n=1 Tax=Stomatohabitans albus TaxID=3110766 RepID=UPI00300D7912